MAWDVKDNRYEGLGRRKVEMVILTKDKCNCSNSNQCESHEQEQFLIYRKKSDNCTNGEQCKNGNEVQLRRIMGGGLDEMHDMDIL